MRSPSPRVAFAGAGVEQRPGETSVNGFSALGLVEMTRKRTRKALSTYYVTNAQPATVAER